jgi:hypothetical protein
MNSNQPLPINKKLTVLFRVEPGCLGPEGEKLVKEYCELAQSKMEVVESNCINWVITPRNDKIQPELQFKINGKILDRGKAEKYLSFFAININVLERQLFKNITDLIEQYLGR